MSGDIEEFLRRAAARRVQQKAGKTQPAQPQQRSVAPQPPRQATRPAAPMEVELVEDDIASMVDAHIDTQRFEQRAKAAGARIGRTDERVEARLHEKFDHDVGALRTPTPSAPAQQEPQGPSFAREIARMLANPADIRRAIILSEIMNPPTHRWND